MLVVFQGRIVFGLGKRRQEEEGGGEDWIEATVCVKSAGSVINVVICEPSLLVCLVSVSCDGPFP